MSFTIWSPFWMAIFFLLFEVIFNICRPWSGWVGNNAGAPVYFKKPIFSAFGWTLRLHKFVAADDPGCYHTHPCYAVRLVIWSGYIEATPMALTIMGKTATIPFYRAWRAGRFGIVRPSFCHRVESLIDGPSYSLWLHGPKVAEIKLVGDGWPPDAATKQYAQILERGGKPIDRVQS